MTIRWSGKEYRLVERAAESSGNPLAAWARTVLLAAARRASNPRRNGVAGSDGARARASDSTQVRTPASDGHL